MSAETCIWCGAWLRPGIATHACPMTGQVHGVPYWDDGIVLRFDGERSRPGRRRADLAVRIVARVALGLAIVALFVACSAILTAARAHDWFDEDCCENIHCGTPAPLGSITWSPEGWRIPGGTICREFGEKRPCLPAMIVPLDDPRIRPVPPEAGEKGAQRIWPCVQPFYDSEAEALALELLCLYIPKTKS